MGIHIDLFTSQGHETTSDCLSGATSDKNTFEDIEYILSKDAERFNFACKEEPGWLWNSNKEYVYYTMLKTEWNPNETLMILCLIVFFCSINLPQNYLRDFRDFLNLRYDRRFLVTKYVLLLPPVLFPLRRYRNW